MRFVNFFLISFILCLWLLIPVSVNDYLSIALYGIPIRFNITASSVACLILLLLLLKRHLSLDRFDIVYIVFVLYVGLVGLFKLIVLDNVYIVYFIYDILTLIMPWIIYKAIKQMPINDQYLIIIVFASICCVVVFEVLLFGIYFGIDNWGNSTSDRAYSTVGAATSTSLLLLTGFSCSIILYFRNRQKFFLFTSMLYLIGMLILQTRSSLILCSIIFFILSIRYKCVKVTFLLFILCCIIYTVNNNIFDNIYLRFFTDNSLNSDELRREYIINGLHKFSDNYLLGTGLGLGIHSILNIQHGMIDSPHNQYISLLAETGILGCFLYYASVCCFVRNILHKKCFDMLSVLVILIFLGGCFEVLLYKDIRHVLVMWMPLIMSNFIIKSEKNE